MRVSQLKPRQIDLLVRTGALAGAATAVALAARRRTAAAWGGATAVALPLATRGVTGRWPLERPAAARAPRELSFHQLVDRPRDEVFAAWRRLDELPRVLRHLDRVEESSEGRSRWRAQTPVGAVEWEAEIVEERPPEMLRWRSLPDSDVVHEGSLELHDAPGGRGTWLALGLRIGSRDERARATVEALVRPALALEIAADLRRFKSWLETGEVPTIAGQSHGERARLEPRNPF